SSAICMDKDIAKTLMKASGLNVAKSLTYTRNQQDAIDFAKSADVLGTPMFIKPANQGSSVGVSKVSTKEEFSAAVDEDFQYDHKIVIEECLIGREIECSVLGNEIPIASLPGEILPQTFDFSPDKTFFNDNFMIVLEG